jgi:hypothetical protein
MVYHAGWFAATALATSEDGVHWERPVLDVDGVTNRIVPISYPLLRDGAGFWLDSFAKDPAEKYKLMVFYRRASHPSMGYVGHRMEGVREEFAEVYTSPDAIHWTPRGRTARCGDNSNFYYNPFDHRWYYSIRTNGLRGRQRSYHAHPDFVEGRIWAPEDLKLLAIADDHDRADPTAETPPEIYNFDAVGYESVMLGVYGILRGPQNPASLDRGVPKITDLEIGFSRDGLNWTRPDRSRPFLSCSKVPGAWNRGYLHASGGVCCVVGDKLHFYVSGFSGHSPMLGTHMYAGGSVALATLRRDGFASLHAGGSGEMTTRPLTFRGKHLFVNANAAGGELRVAVLDPEGNPLPGFGAEDCQVIREDGVTQRIDWRGADLGRLAGQPVRFRFMLQNGDLYAFWVSRLPGGASDGFLGAGGPGYSGVIDNA